MALLSENVFWLQRQIRRYGRSTERGVSCRNACCDGTDYFSLPLSSPWSQYSTKIVSLPVPTTGTAKASLKLLSGFGGRSETM